MKKFAVLVFAVLAVGFAFLLHGPSASAKAAPDEALVGVVNASDMTIHGLAGEKPVFLNFWATWCPPCLEEMDELADFAKTLPDNVQLVTYCVDGTQHKDECARILEEAGFEGKTMISANGDFTTLIEQMQYVPTTIFVDSVGRQLCDSLIGSPNDLASAYTERINAVLKSLGKDTL